MIKWLKVVYLESHHHATFCWAHPVQGNVINGQRRSACHLHPAGCRPCQWMPGSQVLNINRVLSYLTDIMAGGIPARLSCCILATRRTPQGNEEGILIGPIEFWVVAPLSYFTPEMSLGALSYCGKFESPTRSTCSALKRTLSCFIVSKLLVCKVLCYNLSCYTPENQHGIQKCM